MMMNAGLVVRSAAFAVLALGCVASAQFHSRTGASYPRVARRAVLVSEADARAIVAAGGIVIGTISGKGMTVNSSQQDVADKAGSVAAESGGTHIVLTSAGVEQFENVTPATVNQTCTDTNDASTCTTTYTPETSSTYEKPTADYVVLRVAPQDWPRLPNELRPAAP
jgi:hypothetical protein